MSGNAEPLSTVRDAVAIVCEVSRGALAAATRFEDLGADSLALVSIADVIEASVAAGSDRVLHIDDASLGRMATLGELAEYVAAAPAQDSPSARAADPASAR
jgi:acyl carrier protein